MPFIWSSALGQDTVDRCNICGAVMGLEVTGRPPNWGMQVLQPMEQKPTPEGARVIQS